MKHTLGWKDQSKSASVFTNGKFELRECPDTVFHKTRVSDFTIFFFRVPRFRSNCVTA